MKVTIDKETFVLDVEKAKQFGFLLKEKLVKANNIPLLAGDVFKCRSKSINDFLLVQAIYVYKHSKAERKVWQLLGLKGTSPNSGTFFEELHTIKEIEDYLELNDMYYSHSVGDLLYK